MNRQRYPHFITGELVASLVISMLVLSTVLMGMAGVATAQTVVATISVGTTPEGVGVNPTTNKVYVSNNGSSDVSVINGATDTILGVPIGLPGGPTGVGANPTNNKIYVAWSNNVSVINGATDTVTVTIPISSLTPEGVGVNATTNKIYVANYSLIDNTVTVIDSVTDAVTSNIPIVGPTNPRGVGVNSTTNKIYVTNETSNNVSVINGATDTVVGGPITVGLSPWAVGVNPTTNRIYVANYNGNSVSVIDGATDTVVGAPIPVQIRPSGVSVNPATNKIYVTNDNSNSMSVIDGATNTVTATVGVGANPNGVYFNPATNKIYAANSGANSVSVIYDPNPIPALASIDPTSKTAGDAGFTLTVNGSNFMGGSVVNYNLVPKATTFVNSSLLTAEIPASDVAAAGVYPVTVTNPGPGGGTSNTANLTVEQSMSQNSPTVSNVDPTSGPVGTEVTIRGSNFGATQGESKVFFGDMEASASHWSDTLIRARVPTDAAGGRVRVMTTSGEGGGADFSVTGGLPPEPIIPSVNDHPELKDNYFAEGNTREGFDEYLCMLNPGKDASVNAQVFFALENGQEIPTTVEVLPQSRLTISVRGFVEPNHDVAVRVHSDGFLVVERPMYFTMKTPTGVLTGGDVSMGINSPQRSWYFAEGCTRTTPRSFDEYICVLNPGDKSTSVTTTFMPSEGENFVQNVLVKPRSRYTVRACDVVGLEKDVAASVVSDEPVVAERVMYFNYGGWVGGHNAVGLNAPQSKFYFAEGCTRVDVSRGMQFSEWLSMQNPNEGGTHVRVDFLLENGTVIPYEVDVPPRKRHTVSVTGVVGQGHDVSAVVESDRPIVAERPMYFAIGPINGGHNVMGAPSSDMDFYFAEGTTRSGFDEWVSIMNPTGKRATVTMYISTSEGDELISQVLVEPHSRKTWNAASAVGTGKDISIRVASNEPVLAERPIYFKFSAFNGGSVDLGWGPME